MQKYPEVWPLQNWWRSRGSSQRAEFRPPTVSVSSLLFWQDWTEIWRLRRYTLRLVRCEHESLITEIFTWSAWSRRCQYDTRGLSLSSPSSPPPCWCWSVSAGTFPLLNITKLISIIISTKTRRRNELYCPASDCTTQWRLSQSVPRSSSEINFKMWLQTLINLSCLLIIYLIFLSY